MSEDKIWSSADTTSAHLKYGKHIEKNITILKKLLKDSSIRHEDLKNILDWGPGGGWLSKEIAGDKLFLFDVVEAHKEIQRKNCAESFNTIQFHNVSGSKYPKINCDIDLAILFSVIYHMPNISYVKEAIKQLRSYKPKLIAIRNVFSKTEENWEAPSFSKQTMFRMNLFNKSLFLELLPEYKVISKNEPTEAPSLNGPPCYVQSILLQRIETKES